MRKIMTAMTIGALCSLWGDNFIDLNPVPTKNTHTMKPKDEAHGPTATDNAHSDTSHVAPPQNIPVGVVQTFPTATGHDEKKMVVVDVDPNSELGGLIRDLKKELSDLKAERAKEKAEKALAAKKAKEAARKKALAIKKAKALAAKRAKEEATKKAHDVQGGGITQGGEENGFEAKRVPTLEEPCDDKLLPPPPKKEDKGAKDSHASEAKKDAHAPEAKKDDHAPAAKKDDHAPAKH